jgi:hypothetical protein
MLFLIGRWVGAFRVRSLGIVASLLVVAGTARAATPPAIEFDLAPTAVCRPVTAQETLRQHPGMNLVEVCFDLSTRVIAGNETDIKHITVEIKSPDRQLLLVGFSPATTLLSESSSGFIEIEEHRASGQIAIEYGIPNAKVQASAKNAGDSKIVEKKLAPKALLVSATTIDRSHGVVFKIMPSSQDSLQKTRQFVCQFAVPKSFCGDYIQLTCSAVGTNRGPVRSLDSEVAAGSARYTVGVYLDGNAEARRAAEVLAQRQETLAHLISQQADLARQKKAAPWWHNVSQTVWTSSHGAHKSESALEADELASAAAGVERAQRAMRNLNGQQLAN